MGYLTNMYFICAYPSPVGESVMPDPCHQIIKVNLLSLLWSGSWGRYRLRLCCRWSIFVLRVIYKLSVHTLYESRVVDIASVGISELTAQELKILRCHIEAEKM